MSFTRRIKYFLVHFSGYTNKQADALIRSGSVKVNGKEITENVLLAEEEEVAVYGEVLRERKKHIYIRFNKPPGFQSSLSKNVHDSLYELFKDYKELSIAGRLDKASEGLLLLSTDGKWVEKIVNPANEKEKEYLVHLDKEPTDEFLQSMRKGVMLGDGITRPCVCEAEYGRAVKIILTEGRNRQIRRMCHKLGYQVIRLRRIRIETIDLKGLKEGEFKIFKI